MFLKVKPVSNTYRVKKGTKKLTKAMGRTGQTIGDKFATARDARKTRKNKTKKIK